MDGKPCNATPAAELRSRIMDSRIPKGESEWWAHREIERLERELAAVNERIRRVVEAGDALFQQFHHPTLQTHQWTQAKEAKP
jgi:hypothetical protein